MRKLARSLYLGAIALVFAVPVSRAAAPPPPGSCQKVGPHLTICRDKTFAIETGRGVFRVYAPNGVAYQTCIKTDKGLSCTPFVEAEDYATH